jgi:hypothetical protein
MKKLIDFIIEQGLVLHDYPTLHEPLKERFEITDLNGNEAAEQLLIAVMFWEKHTEICDSLEKFLSDKFIIKRL